MRRTLLVSMFMFACLAVHGHGAAKEKIIWPYICYHPIFICDKDTLVGGAGWEIYRLMWERMPEYEHEALLLPIKRIIKDMEEGKHYLFWGLYKTPEREKVLNYSLPCRISPPTMVVIRKGDFQNFSGDKPGPLKALLDNKRLKFLRFNAISFGPEVDQVVKQYEKMKNVYVDYRSDNMDKIALDLLLKKRVDYFLALNGTAQVAAEMGVADQLAFIPITEQIDYKVGYIVAPKNEWGRGMIRKVDEVLRKEVPTDAFFAFFKPLVNENMVPELRRQYNALVAEPARSQDKVK